MFVFISGYIAGFVYGPAMLQGRAIVATGRLLKRCWQLYVTHVLLAVVFIAEIAYVGGKFDNPHCPAINFGICDVFTSMSGFRRSRNRPRNPDPRRNFD